MREMPAKSATVTASPAFNEAESPLTWLRSRRGKDGKPLISEVQYLAGERLRMDFERARLARRTTLNWDLAGAGARSGNVSAELSDGAIAARQRYHAALDSVGPELASMLAQVCCLSAGIEQAERNAGGDLGGLAAPCWAWPSPHWHAIMAWPRRSAGTASRDGPSTAIARPRAERRGARRGGLSGRPT